MMKQVWFIFSISLWFLATPVHGGWAGSCLSGFGATCSTSNCCWGTNDSSQPVIDQCSGGHTSVCNGTPNSNKIYCGACCGAYTCNQLDSSTVIGPYSCHGGSSCFQLKGSVGQQSCIGDYACYQGSSLTIGDNTCNGQAACNGASSTTFGSNSCNSSGNHVCWSCENSDVPSNECNNIADGWSECGNTSRYNYCIYCSNCKNKDTQQSCYVSVLPATVQARRTLRRLKAKKTSPDSSNENEMDCNELKETITTFFKTVEDDALKKLIGKYIKSETKKNKKNPNLCTITFDVMFEHLNEEELERTCDALQTVFSEHVEEFKKSNLGFADMTFSCEPKDQNANKGKEPKKKGGKKKRKRIPEKSTALVAQSDGA